MYVQLAPYGWWLGGTGEKYPELRRRQEMVGESVPGAYMASIMDLGMYEDIHPKHKKKWGNVWRCWHGERCMASRFCVNLRL